MTGDYTRLTFRPERAYSSVRLQQGRVQVDADWNEAADIGLHLDRTTTRDVVGRTGVPEEAPGFALAPADPDGGGGGTDLLIGFGRAYLDGMLVENLRPAPTTLEPVADAPGDFRVLSGPVPRLGAWLVDPADPAAPAARVTALPDPVDADGGLVRVTLAPAPAAASLVRVIAPSLLAQPDLDGDPVPPASGLYALYLEAFEREVTALDDPLLRETALGGPDTCLRTQVVWQVRADDGGGGTSCQDFPPGWSPDAAPRARLAARGVPATVDDDPCLTPDPGGYRGVDNRLYRVEVHRGGDVEADAVLVKWSRDNAVHRTRYAMVDEALRVESLGRDDATALDQGQWVELQDEAAWRAGRPGHFVRLGEANGRDLAVAEIRDPATNLPLTDADGDPQLAALPAAGLLRRWEGGPPVPVAADVALALEAGIEVTLGAGRLAAGDWWTIPARALTATVEWPADPANGEAAALPPQAVVRRHMALGIVERTAEGRLLPRSDCRRIFPPLTSLITFQMLGGDGQEAMPDLTPGGEGAPAPLAAPFRVGVSRGLVPIPGRLVRFATEDDDPGVIAPAAGTPADRILRADPQELIVATDEAGVAEAQFSVHGRRVAYTVEARLLDAAEPEVADPQHLPIRFFAAAEVAAEVAYDPAGCLYQQQAPGTESPAVTVQEAIDRLCPAILFAILGGDGQVALPARPLPSFLRVGLLWGGRPLAGTPVRFELLSGDALLSAQQVVTAADGTAAVEVRAGDDSGQDEGVIRVRATPIAPPQATWPASLEFTARFATGAPPEPARIRVVDILTLGPAQRPLRPLLPITPEEAALGFLLRLDTEVEGAIGENWSAGEVWVDVPVDPGGTGGLPAGGLAFRPDGRLLVGDPASGRRDVLHWEFTERAQDWIRRSLPTLLNRAERAVATARLVVHGGAVFARGDPPRWLDGGLLFQRNGIDLVRPSGVGVPGSTLLMPFQIGRGGGGIQPQPGGGFVLAPVTGSRRLDELLETDRARISAGLDLAVDRAALHEAGAEAGDAGEAAPRGGASRPPREVRDLLRPLAAQPSPLRVLVRRGDRGAAEALLTQLRERAGVTLAPVLSAARTAAAFARELSGTDAPELALGDARFLSEVGRLLSEERTLGPPLLRL